MRNTFPAQAGSIGAMRLHTMTVRSSADAVAEARRLDREADVLAGSVLEADLRARAEAMRHAADRMLGLR